MLSLIQIATAYNFNQVSPVIWTKTDNQVETGTVRFNITLTLPNKCSSISSELESLPFNGTTWRIFNVLKDRCQLYCNIQPHQGFLRLSSRAHVRIKRRGFSRINSYNRARVLNTGKKVSFQVAETGQSIGETAAAILITQQIVDPDSAFHRIGKHDDSIKTLEFLSEINKKLTNQTLSWQSDTELVLKTQQKINENLSEDMSELVNNIPQLSVIATETRNQCDKLKNNHHKFVLFEIETSNFVSIARTVRVAMHCQSRLSLPQCVSLQQTRAFASFANRISKPILISQYS